MEKKLLKSELALIKRTDLESLIFYLSEIDSNINNLILDWIEKNNESNKQPISLVHTSSISMIPKTIVDESPQTLLWKKWDILSRLLSKLENNPNCSDDDLSEFFSIIDSLTLISSNNEIDDTCKSKLINKIFVYYNNLDDTIKDTFLDFFSNLCTNSKLWTQVVNLLEESPSDNDYLFIMNIYKDKLNNEEKFLKIKREKFGMTSLELAKYYIDTKQDEKAISACEEALLNHEEPIADIYNYLLDFYIKYDEGDKLNKLVNESFNNIEITKNIIDKTLRYYLNNGDMYNYKQLLISAFKVPYEKNYFEEYKKIKQYIDESEFISMRPSLLNIVKFSINTKEDYLQICLYEKLYDNIIETLKSVKTAPPEDNNFKILDKFADHLKERFPIEIIDYYISVFEILLKVNTDGVYDDITKYIEKIQYIYIEILDSIEKWMNFIYRIELKYGEKVDLIENIRKLVSNPEE